MKGLYPKVLEELHIRRNSLKRCLALLNDKKEELEKKINLAEERGIVITDTLKSEYSSVVFNITCLDAKQLALKSKRFSVKYGDTDSLYFVCPEKCFQKCDETYDNGNGISKEEYWSRMINIFMEVIERLRDEVNDFLRNDNGSSYLKMAYEEVLFPVIVKRRQSKHFREVGKKVMDESMKIDLNGIVKTAIWKPNKNKKSVQRFISQMGDRYTCEEADAK
ncbi:203_t:CDS:2 [Funneliformis geosporum]|uniref:6671_t:CDS:1 n=1 Tax=Funneliformis geosporum TaxID=1117311 RepID=A0A9W4T0Q2_9GLOM|nr:6671_t:CDS:2 [Funneliformis geosporum]CAI2188814.1 203_t:CDS:2 [Funneliformis geosporum]